jgi:hypothetical protein
MALREELGGGEGNALMHYYCRQFRRYISPGYIFGGTLCILSISLLIYLIEG